MQCITQDTWRSVSPELNKLPDLEDVLDGVISLDKDAYREKPPRCGPAGPKLWSVRTTQGID